SVPAVGGSLHGFVVVTQRPLGVFGTSLFPGRIRLAISSVTVTNGTGEIQTFGLDRRARGGAATCTGARGAFHRDGQISVQPHETLEVTYPVPLVLSSPSPGAAWCVRATPFRSDARLAITVVGFRT